ncbi:hypothetical protein RI054_30g120180 [Pseudoscourfieldia marina]
MLAFREAVSLAMRATAAVAILCVLALVPSLANPVTSSPLAGVAATLAIGRTVGASARKAAHQVMGGALGAALASATLATIPHVDGALLPLLFAFSFAVVLARPPPLAAKTCLVVLGTALAGVGGAASPYNAAAPWEAFGAAALGSALALAAALLPVASARTAAERELHRACVLCGGALKAGLWEWAEGGKGVDVMRVEWLDELLRRAEVAGGAFQESLQDAAWELRAPRGLVALRARRQPLEDLFAALRGLLRVLRRRPFVHSPAYHAAFVERLRQPLEALAEGADGLLRCDGKSRLKGGDIGDARARLVRAKASFAEEYRAARLHVIYGEARTELSPPDLLTLNLVFFSATLFCEAALEMHPEKPAAAGDPPLAGRDPPSAAPTFRWMLRWDDGTKRALRQAAAMLVAGLWAAFGRDHTDTTAVLTVGYVVGGASVGASFKTSLQRVEGTAAGVLGPGLLLIAVDGTSIGAALTLLPYVFSSMYASFASEDHAYSGVVSAFTAIGVSLGKNGEGAASVRDFVLRRLEDTFIACAAFVLCELALFPSRADSLLGAALRRATGAAANAVAHVNTAAGILAAPSDGVDGSSHRLARGELRLLAGSLAAAEGYLKDGREEPRLWRPAFPAVRLARLLTDIAGIRTWLELQLRVAERTEASEGFSRLMQPLLHPLELAGEHCSLALTAVGDQSEDAVALGEALGGLADGVATASEGAVNATIGAAAQARLAPLVESDDVLAFSALAFVIEELLAQVRLCCRDVAALSYQEASIERLKKSIGLSRLVSTIV